MATTTVGTNRTAIMIVTTTARAPPASARNGRPARPLSSASAKSQCNGNVSASSGSARIATTAITTMGTTTTGTTTTAGTITDTVRTPTAPIIRTATTTTDTTATVRTLQETPAL